MHRINEKIIIRLESVKRKGKLKQSTNVAIISLLLILFGSYAVHMVKMHMCIYTSKCLHWKHACLMVHPQNKNHFSWGEAKRTQQQQKPLTDNYIKWSADTVRVMSSEGGGVFRCDRPAKKKNASLLPYLVCLQPSVWRILQRISRAMCNSNPHIVCAQIQYIPRSLAVTCNWLLQASGTRLISFFHHLSAEPIWKSMHWHPPRDPSNWGRGCASCTGNGTDRATAKKKNKQKKPLNNM